ncbi:MAG: carboxylating nicotinate-nucleotide diphosphorylase [Bacteroidales bacterium]|nr:carboxylating nicotinate-nucleotide diphosphorylase [Bacteroidales bacterium]
MMDISNLDTLIRMALHEDIGDGDHSTLACIPPTAQGQAKMIAKQDGIICGIDVAIRVFELVDPTLNIIAVAEDGDIVDKGDLLMLVSGPAASILTAERTALNYIQRLSGIATEAHRMVALLDGLHTRLLDTRKTTPNMRMLEKYAVHCGGATNHRFGLFDMVMLKDNHIDFAGGIEPAIDRTHEYLKAHNKDLRIEIEVRNLDELDTVLRHGGVDRIMLDNFDIDTLRTAVQRIAGRYETEASGGITEKTLRQYAETGVDFISVGALTHHIKSLDISLVSNL